jgi:hypothetical protein
VLVQPEMENRRFSVSEYTAISAGQFGTIPEMARTTGFKKEMTVWPGRAQPMGAQKRTG